MKHSLTFEEFVIKFFTKTTLYYLRNKDQYRFNSEDVDIAREYYNKTGINP